MGKEEMTTGTLILGLCIVRVYTPEYVAIRFDNGEDFRVRACAVARDLVGHSWLEMPVHPAI